jgi:enediyne biosynthesis protein E4
MQLQRRTLFAVFKLSAVSIFALVLSQSSKATEQICDQRPGSAFTAIAPPPVRFTDVTREAGLSFTQGHGPRDGKSLPELMSGGCAFLDYDADGDQDILLIHSGSPKLKRRAAVTLFENSGRGKFKEVTKAAGLNIRAHGMGVAVGDYDNDGHSDLFITALGKNRLFHNEGGRFREVSGSAGVQGTAGQWSTSCGFADYNNDGRLDLFVCNYAPSNAPGVHPYLYRNDGGGKFTEISAAAGLRQQKPGSSEYLSRSLGVAPVDLDGDGWMDFAVANDAMPNQVFHNQRDGTFREIGASSGLAYDGFGNSRGARGIDTSWFGDGASLGIAIANSAHEMNGFYAGRPYSLRFVDTGPVNPVGTASRRFSKFGLVFFDYDLDGWPDLLTANGRLDGDFSKAGKVQDDAQPAQLFWNGGPQQDVTFAPVTPDQSGPDLFQPIAGRGASFADMDGDGDLDVLLTQAAGAPVLLRNDQQLGHRYLRLKLTGAKSNRDAIGVRVTLKSRTRIWQAQVMPTRGYLSQSELPITFGFGAAELPSEMEIRWPSGQVQRIPYSGKPFMAVQEPEL